METSLPNAEGDPIWCRYQSFVLFNGVGCPVRHVGRLLDTHDMVMREATLRKKAEPGWAHGRFQPRGGYGAHREGPGQRGLLARLQPLPRGCGQLQASERWLRPSLEGDRVLKEIAAFLGRNQRKDDVVARLGGDEFAVFAAGLVPGPALERVLAQLSGGIYARNPRPADMPEDLQPSVSIGAVVCTRTSVTFDDLYQVADEALYVAKRGGKSQAALRRLD